MKMAGRRIPKGNFLLLFSFAAITLCLFLILAAVRAERRNRLSQNTLYSGYQKGFSIHNADDPEQWLQVIPELAHRHSNFAVYIPVPDPDFIVRGICVMGEAQTPPILEGNYFDSSTSWTDRPAVVLGKQYRGAVTRSGGKMYYRYRNVEYEVIGIMGDEVESRLDQMILMDFKSALRITGINTEYVLDTGRESDLTQVGQDIADLFHSPAEVLIILDDGYRPSVIADLLSDGAVMGTLYILILMSFSLSTLLVTFIWLRFRRQLIFAYFLCGYEKHSQAFEICRRFFLIAGGGFGAGFLMMALVSRYLADIHLVFQDVLTAFGITVGLGSGILFFCYFAEGKRMECS